MGLLDKLKSLFGSDQSGQSPARGNEADPTVEYEPSAESEHAVKGTDTGRQQGGQQGTQPQGGQQQGQPQARQPASGQTAEPQTTDEVAGGADEMDPDATTTTQATDAADEPVESDDEQTDDVGESHSVEEIKGIGPTYAERLEAAGIGTVADLAASDATTVAEAAETGENRAGEWVERAQDF